jgi:hypothetical protein
VIAVVFEGLVGHDRSQIRSADADIDDIANAFARLAVPGAGADPQGEIGHLVENGMNLRHDVFAIVHDRSAARRAQGHVQHGTVFRDVDIIAPKHGLDAIAQPRFLGDLDKQADGFIGDAVLGIVEVEPRSF